MDGLLVIDKPRACTSHDMVLRVRRITGVARVGHAGTLDPEATGVLLVAVGQATRLFPYLARQEKTYEGTIRLGYATDTYDAAGRAISEERPADPPETDVRAAMKSLEGAILQAPPPYSAKKLRGQPAYKLARSRREFRLEPVPVVIRSFALRSYAPPFVEFEVRCSSGTYVRSLAHEVGRLLGCGAHLHSLRRTSVGPYAVERALPPAAVEEAAAAGRLGDILIPLERLLPDIPAVVVRPEFLARLLNGSPVLPGHLDPESAAALSNPEPAFFRVVDGSGKLRALARPSPGRDRLQPFFVIS
jgi:tRNA pseudouridine55 synthase